MNHLSASAFFNLLILFFTISCGSEKPDSGTTGSQIKDSSQGSSSPTILAKSFSGSDTASYALDFDSAKGMVAAYVDFARSNYGDSSFAKAFMIRSSTLQQVMLTDNNGAPGVDYIRAYIGRDPKGQFRLFLVPVNQVSSTHPKGTDSLMRGNYFRGEVKPGVPLTFGNYVWDFTTSCPEQCPDESPNSLYVD